MVINMRKIACMLSLLAVTLLFSACSGGASYQGQASASSTAAESEFNMAVRADTADAWETASAAPAAEYAEDPMDEAVEAESLLDSGGSASVTAPPSSDRKIITTVDLRMESTEYDRCVNSIYRAIEAAGGYIEYSDIAGSIDPADAAEPNDASFSGGVSLRPMSSAQEPYYSDSYGYREGDWRYLRMHIRVPQNGLPGFLSRLESFGNVLSKQESAKDVTLQYVDVESHKKALLAEQERLLAMLERSVDVEAMILLEHRLSEVRYQLESYESQLRVLENQVSYATVNLTLREVIIYTEKAEPEIPNPTVSERISTGFARTMNDIRIYWTNWFVWVAVNIVYIAGVLIVLAAAFILFRRYMKKHTRPVAAATSAAPPIDTPEKSDWTLSPGGKPGDEEPDLKKK